MRAPPQQSRLPVAVSWYSVTEVAPGVHLIVEPHVARLFRANFLLVRGRKRDLLVDTGMGIGDLAGLFGQFGLRKPIIFTTHTHIDHIGGHSSLTGAEFLVHPLEANALRALPMPAGLSYAQFTEADRARFRAAGFDTNGLLIDALPHAEFDPYDHHFRGIEPSRLVGEGEVIDLGDRRLTALHVPGHSPGSIALWDAADGALFAGDAVYDGVLVDTLDGSDIPTYLATMERLRNLPVRVVHGGHRASFGRDRMVAIIDDYIASRTGQASRPEGPTISF
jgi:glyoxylase-like metal-dependent hydrolase (beta-lactamase superfamily II)